MRRIEGRLASGLNAAWYDIETAQGYGGPLSTTGDRSFLSAAWEAFAGWCRETGVVAEFIRFNPFTGNDAYVDEGYQVWTDRELVVAGLEGTEQELWARYPSTQRNMVRKALKSGLVCEESLSVEAQDAFRRLHELTMKQNEAPLSSYFPDAFYNYLWNELAAHVKLFVVRHEGQIIASALFMTYGERMHYQFGNSDTRCREYGANNLLLHTAAQWGAAHGLRRLNLGGGRTRSSDDALLRFKSSISRSRLPYRLGKRIRNREAYDALCSAWLHEKGQTELPSHSFPYRLP
jgi:hypothetical protein